MKIKAFTILEMIINLALMGIIVSMVYLVYLYFSKNMGEYSTITSEDFEVRLFHTLLKEDFFFSEQVISENGKDLRVIFYDEKEISYIQKDDYFYRIVSFTKDSIPLKHIEIQYLLEVKEKDSKNPVRSISVTTEIMDQEIDLFASKEYFSNYRIVEE